MVTHRRSDDGCNCDEDQKNGRELHGWFEKYAQRMFLRRPCPRVLPFIQPGIPTTGTVWAEVLSYGISNTMETTLCFCGTRALCRIWLRI